MQEVTTQSESEVAVPTVTVTQTQTIELPEEHTVLSTPASEPDEYIVYDRAEDGTVTGWHKEQVNV